MPSYQNKNKKMKAKKRARKNAPKPKKTFISPLAMKASQMAKAYIQRRVKELKVLVANGTTRSDLRDLAKAAGMKNGEIGNQKDVPNEKLIVRIAEAEVRARKPWRK